MTNEQNTDDDYNFYFLIGIASHVILSISILMYGYCSKLPTEIKNKYIKSVALSEIVSMLFYCLLSPIFAPSPPSIVILVMAFYAVNVMYAVIKHEKYMADHREIILINHITGRRDASNQSVEPIRTIETETHLPEMAQSITCQYVQYTNAKLPITIIQPDGNIMLGKMDTHLNTSSDTST